MITINIHRQWYCMARHPFECKFRLGLMRCHFLDFGRLQITTKHSKICILDSAMFLTSIGRFETS